MGDGKVFMVMILPIVDLGQIDKVQFFNIGAIQDVRSWIWFPKEVEYEVSNNGKDLKK